jgi:hypothetical protein
VHSWTDGRRPMPPSSSHSCSPSTQLPARFPSTTNLDHQPRSNKHHTPLYWPVRAVAAHRPTTPISPTTVGALIMIK